MKGLKRYSVFMKFEGRCSYCGCPLNYAQMQVDHFYPKALFRSQKLVNGLSINSFDNLMPSCGSCNLSKKDLSIEAFRSKIDNLPFYFANYHHLFRLAVRYGLILSVNQTTIFHFEK